MEVFVFEGLGGGGPLNLENVGFQGMRGLPKLNRKNTSLFDLYHIRGGGVKLVISENLWRKW